ncbi:MAG: ABC transporter ATP-binding protein [Eubacteriales bacterium]|nr:ABC transporter ATP-binding protein [Eubacteriales bacterium]
MAIISIKGLTKTYKTKNKTGLKSDSQYITAVDDVTLDVEQGEIFGLVGSNGAGKTTLIKLMLGLTKADSGSVTICGYDSDKDSEKVLSCVGAIVEEPTLFKDMTGMQNLTMLARLGGGLPQSRIDQVVEIVGLKERINTKFSTYSLGMRQRLGIAQAIMHSPQVLLLDEPINGFDPQGIIEMRGLLRTLAKEYGTTILVSSHILSELEELCDRVGIMKRGKLIAVDTIANLQKDNNEIILRMTCSDVIKAAQIIAELKDIQVKVVDQYLYVKCTSEQQISDVTAALVGAGVAITSINTKKKTLEQIYMETVK